MGRRGHGRFFLTRFGAALSTGLRGTGFFLRLFFRGFAAGLTLGAFEFFALQFFLMLTQGDGTALFFGTALCFGSADDFNRLLRLFGSLGLFLAAAFGFAFVTCSCGFFRLLIGCHGSSRLAYISFRLLGGNGFGRRFRRSVCFSSRFALLFAGAAFAVGGCFQAGSFCFCFGTGFGARSLFCSIRLRFGSLKRLLGTRLRQNLLAGRHHNLAAAALGGHFDGTDGFHFGFGARNADGAALGIVGAAQISQQCGFVVGCDAVAAGLFGHAGVIQLLQ